MYELLRQRITSAANTEEGINRAREFLQILILKIMFDCGVFNNLAFVGGTALRIFFGLRRYSEDLDFNLTSRRGYDFRDLLNRLAHELKLCNLKAEMSAKESGAIQSSMVKFPRVLKEMGLSGHPRQKLSIKLEIDTNSPRGWINRLYPVSDIFVFAVNSFDLPSLYATKLHACFFRPYTKGRDFYDLVWYLGQRIEPNYVLLNNAIKQTEKQNLNIGPENLKSFLSNALGKVDFSSVRKDIERFLEDKSELKTLDRNTILKMIK